MTCGATPPEAEVHSVDTSRITEANGMTNHRTLRRIAGSIVAAVALVATAPASAYPIPPALDIGLMQHVAYSQVVRDIQAALNARGYDAGPADGFYGARTGAAIRAYQRDNNLLTDGQASSALLQHIRGGQAQLLQSQPKAQPPQDDGDQRRRAIERTQDRLATLGYSIRRTGEIDWQTRLAISDYQRDNKLEVDGEFDRELALHIRDRADNSGGLSTAELTDIERGLDARGYDTGAVDGRIDDKAKAAIRAYQRDRGDPATGAVSVDLARQLAVGLGPSLNTPETVAEVQSKLNSAGYDAGPADGVMGPSTRNAIRRYRIDNDLGDSTTITQDLLASLEDAKPAPITKAPEAEKSGRPEIGFRLLMQDDFEDGDFTRNPNWQVHAGEFQVLRGYLAVKLPDAQTQASAAQQQSITQFLRQAMGAQVRSPEAVAAIAQGTGIENAFKIEATLLGSARDIVQMHIGPYIGRDLTSGYRLVYDQAANDRLALIARTGGRTAVIAEKFGVTQLGDGRKHALEWVRNQNGLMVVRVDGGPLLRVKDDTISGSFSGISFVNLAGAWNIHDIAAYAYE